MAEMSFTKLIKLVLRHLVLIILCAVIGLFAGYGYAKLYTNPTYTSSIKLMVVTVDQETPNSAALNTMERLVNSFIEWLNSRRFYSELLQEYPQIQENYGYTASGLFSSVAFNKKEGSEAFTCYVTTNSFESCEAISEALEGYMSIYISTRYPDYVRLGVVDDHTVPYKNSANAAQTGIFGALLGGGLVLLILILRESSDTRIKSEEELTERISLPLLGTIPEFTQSMRKNTRYETAEEGGKS